MTPPTNAPNSAHHPIPKDVIKQAVAEGKALLKDGKTKREAAMLIYQKLKGADRETIVAAFKEGAGLTDMGATTYWYNCRRIAAKAAAK